MIYKLILQPLDLTYLQTIVFILIIAALVQFVEMFLKKSMPSLYKALGVYLPLITTKRAVLGVALTNVQKDYNILEGTVKGFATAFGFSISIVPVSYTHISARIPLTYIGSFAVFVIIYMLASGKGFDVNYLLTHLCGGGLMLGAWFMATDYVTSPITPKGQYVYGVCLGVLTGIFRIFGASAEGVSYAIIFCNQMCIRDRHVGDSMEAKVLKVNDGEGQVILTYKRLAAEKGNKRLEEAFENQEVLKAPVTQVLDGGLCVNEMCIRDRCYSTCKL